MHCNEMKEFLYEYLTNKLNAEARKEIDAHLKTCPACQQELDELKIDLNLLKLAEPPKVSFDFKDRVMSKIEQPRARVIPFKRKKVYKYVLQGTVAAVVVLAVAVTLIVKSQQQPQGPVVRGAEKETVLSKECKKAVELYNKGTSTQEPRDKEIFFKDALACNCGDRRILAKIKNNLADCLEKQGNQQETINLYKAAIEDDPNLFYPYIGLGDYYKKQGDKAAAIPYYKKALELLKTLQLTERPDEQEIKRIQSEIEKFKAITKP